jgi:hypothetical protein
MHGIARSPFKSQCNVSGDRQRASSTLRSFGERRTSLTSGTIPIFNHDSGGERSEDLHVSSRTKRPAKQDNSPNMDMVLDRP